jgi:hypothetical protein
MTWSMRRAAFCVMAADAAAPVGVCANAVGAAPAMSSAERRSARNMALVAEVNRQATKWVTSLTTTRDQPLGNFISLMIRR